jgi:hypothetical protein
VLQVCAELFAGGPSVAESLHQVEDDVIAR